MSWEHNVRTNISLTSLSTTNAIENWWGTLSQNRHSHSRTKLSTTAQFGILLGRSGTLLTFTKQSLNLKSKRVPAFTLNRSLANYIQNKCVHSDCIIVPLRIALLMSLINILRINKFWRSVSDFSTKTNVTSLLNLSPPADYSTGRTPN